MDFKFSINCCAFSKGDCDQFLKTATACNATIMLEFLFEEKNEVLVCEEVIAETAREARLVAIAQGHTVAIIKQGDEVAIDLHKGTPVLFVRKIPSKFHTETVSSQNTFVINFFCLPSDVFDCHAIQIVLV